MIKMVRNLLLPKVGGPTRIRFGTGRGIFLDLSRDNILQRIYGLEEVEVAGYVPRFMPRVNTYIDVGASDGYYCLLAHFKNPAAKILGFEPQAKYREVWLRNLELNQLSACPRFQWRTEFVGNGGANLDRIISPSAGHFLLKVDVDGAEMDVLRSASELLNDGTGAVILETHSLQLEHGCNQLLKEAGFNTKIIQKTWWRAFVPERRLIGHNRWLIAEKWGEAV